MPAAAVQQPPKQAAKTGGTINRMQKRSENKDGAKNALHRLPRAAGVVIMALLLALALPVGNFRALQNAAPKDFVRWGDVQSIMEDRVDAGENILAVARRVGMSESEIDAAAQALSAFEGAKTAREISRANQTLTGAVSELAAAENLAQDETYMQRAADEFAELGSFLRQEARAYNEKAEKAVKLYEKLPAKFMLSEPDVYEGI